MRFHESNDISQNFSGTILGFCEVAKYFVDFWFWFWYFQKMTAKFWFPSNRFKISKFQTWRWQKLKKSISQLPIFECHIVHCNTECHFVEYHYVNCHIYHCNGEHHFVDYDYVNCHTFHCNGECHYAGCHYAECHGANQSY